MGEAISREALPIQEEVKELEDKYLTFYIERQLYGMPIADVVQILGMQEITEIPEYPLYAKGVLPLRGEAVPVVDMRLRFGMEERAYDDKTCIIITAIDGGTTGYIVDAVDAVSRIEQDKISAPPNVVRKGGGNDYLVGIGQMDGQTVLLLDCMKIALTVILE